MPKAADALQVIVAQLVDTVAAIAHPQFGERFGIAQRAVERAHHRVGELVDERQFVGRRDARVGRQRLLDKCRARARKADDEDRLRHIGPRRSARQKAHPAFAEERGEALDELARHLGAVEQPADFATEPLALDKRGEGLVVPLHLVEQPAFFEPLIGAQSLVAAQLGDPVEDQQGVVIRAFAALHDGAGQENARIVRRERFGAGQQFLGRVEIAVGFLHPRPTKQPVQPGIVASRRLRIKFPGFRHPALVLQVPGEIDDDVPVAPAGQVEDLLVVVFADLGPVALGHHQAHEVMRLRVLRGEADRIAGVAFGLEDGALAERQQRQIVDRPECVRVQRDDAAQQRLGGGRQILLLAYPVQHGQRVELTGRQFQNAETELVRFVRRVLLHHLPSSFDDRRKRPSRARGRQGRQIELAAAKSAQPAAASATCLGATHPKTSYHRSPFRPV
jgi:hypothetical protein